MDARVKPGHDTECVVALTPRHDSSPVFFTGAGYAVVQIRHSSAFALTGFGGQAASKERGRAERRGAKTPRSPVHDVSSYAQAVFTTECRFPGVPRAMFIGLLRLAPGGLTFSGSLLL